MNCYEAMKRMYEIDEKMQSISKLLCKTNNPKDIALYEQTIDILEDEFLHLKHCLEQTTLNSVIYTGSRK